MNNTNVCPLIYSNKSNISNPLSKSLDDYYDETINHVTKYLPAALKNNKHSNRKVKNIIYYIIHNDDLLSNVVTAIMLADHTHDKTRGSLKYWRSKNCIWTIARSVNKNKMRHQSLDESILEEDENLQIDNLIDKEEHDILCSRIDALDQNEKKICNLYYQDNLPEKKIASIFNVSQQRISQILKTVKNKLNV